ncbi:hypothetical protein FHG87_006822 [Trinorchestia longiramus]|nr:hypothetical protein FHG87_006822 [Trinorchestia longiramus]
MLISEEGWSISSLRRSRRVSLRRMSWIPRPHLDATSWLAALELPQYNQCFSHFAGVEVSFFDASARVVVKPFPSTTNTSHTSQEWKVFTDFLYYEEEAIEKLGVTCGSHRSRIMASLRALREKYEKKVTIKTTTVTPSRDARLLLNRWLQFTQLLLHV